MIRVKGTLRRIEGHPLDFNRFGMALRTDHPISPNQRLIVDITWREINVTNLVAVVHNCISTHKGHRCGLLFRTRGSDQFDQIAMEEALQALEQALVDDLRDQATNG